MNRAVLFPAKLVKRLKFCLRINSPNVSKLNIVRECQLMFNFKLPSEQLENRKRTSLGNIMML